MIARHGKAGAVEFFETIIGWMFHEFQATDMLVSEQRVAVIVVVDEGLPDGQHIRDEEMHLWTFDAGGKIAAFRHVADTEKHIAAASKRQSSILNAQVDAVPGPGPVVYPPRAA